MNASLAGYQIITLPSTLLCLKTGYPNHGLSNKTKWINLGPQTCGVIVGVDKGNMCKRNPGLY